jgi:hypothetical protein
MILFRHEGVGVYMLEFILKPWHLIVLLLASHLNREQQLCLAFNRSCSIAEEIELPKEPATVVFDGLNHPNILRD